MEKSYKNWSKLGASVALALLSTTQLNAAQQMNVTATVPSVCVISSESTALNMAFDLSGLGSASADFTFDVDFLWQCSQGTSAVISIDGGTTAGSETARLMQGPGSNTLAYSLDKPSSGGNWGSGGTNGLSVTGAGLGNEETSVISGTVVLGDAQAAAVGSYLDVVQITMLP